jgi:5-methylcytosine-specific restriction endonuclease McrA
MSGNWAGGSSYAWKKIRRAVILRDGECKLRSSPRCNGRPETVHHTQDRAVVGDDPRFLIAACGPCNYGYGDPTDPKHGNPPANPRTRW